MDSHREDSKNIWFQVRRLDLSEDNPHCLVEKITIENTTPAYDVQSEIGRVFDLPETCTVLKLRNSRGSLLPLNANISSNSKSTPYTLDVVKEHQFVPFRPHGMGTTECGDTLGEILVKYSNRLDELERLSPADLETRRQEKIKEDVDELNKKLIFLRKRFSDADLSKWDGMFKKPPLW